MKTLVISDLHNHIDWVESCIAAELPDEVVFLGDYFDDLDDNANDASKTARWLRSSIEKPNRIHLWGNHDMPYGFPHNPYLACPGSTLDKLRAIKEHITKDHWGQLKLHCFTQGWLLSHAGISYANFSHPINGLTTCMVEVACESALQAAERGMWSIYLAPGCRMGGPYHGGITWQDWFEEFEPVEGFHQIVGHTFGIAVRTVEVAGSLNYCIDCKNDYLTFIEDGKVRHTRNLYKV